MKKFAISCVAAVLFAGLVGSASAAERVPTSTLASMGFSSVHQMSDVDGLTVRGKGTNASVWGASTATKGNDTSTNGYTAASAHSHGSSLANGKNLSYAGTISGSPNHIHFNINVAGGSSSAFAR